MFLNAPLPADTGNSLKDHLLHFVSLFLSTALNEHFMDKQ